tara:strand:- start:177 stop:1217 length:1041 start_codon:yes stop_codon:yes gene_type:complete
MKICIVGGGFYGCYLAYKLRQKYPHSKIALYERNKDILQESAINNQYRLHLGFHYPRSSKTIKETFFGASIFLKEFKRYIYFPKKNIYAIHKNSKVTFKNYIKIFSRFRIPFKIIQKDKYKNYFKDIHDIKGAILTKEGTLLLKQLYREFKKKYLKGVKIFRKTEVLDINFNGEILIKYNKKKFYDLIINTTHINPNMGLKRKIFKLKYENALMVLIKNFLNKDTAITIMDGEFISAYPLNEKLLSLSSVKYTPVVKSNSLKKLGSISNISRNIYAKKIINDVRKYIKLPDKIIIKKITMSPKVKLINDSGDKRISSFVKKKKLISVFCGKLDAAPVLWKKLEKKL